MKVKALLFANVDKVIVDEVEIPEPGIGEVLIETVYSCVSPGTELRCLKGKEKDIEGWPFIPGYSLSGIVVARGQETTLELGTRVFCLGTSKADQACVWGGHTSFAIQREKDVYPLPENVDLLEGSMTKLAAIAYHGFRLSKVAIEEKVVILGLGLIGQLSARLFALSGAQVVAVSHSDLLLETARKVGIEAVKWSRSLHETMHSIFPRGADVVIDTTGYLDVVPQAIELTKDLPWNDSLISGPRYIILGTYMGDFAFPYQSAFECELSFYVARDQQPSDIRAILELICLGKLPIRDLISTVTAPENAAKLYEHLSSSQRTMVTASFKWKA